MDRELRVYIDIARQPVLVGRLWARERNGRETSTFVYDEGWLKRPDGFALAPSLMLTPGPHHSDDLFAAFTDPAPDRWGQKLMRHHERERAAKAGTEPRSLLQADFLIGVDDETRLGALRFKAADEGGYLSQTGRRVPALIELQNLLSASDRIERGRARKGDLALLLAPAGSLGGARPKATVRDREGRLHVAKFPWKNDDWSVILWESVALVLARAAGIQVPEFRLQMAGAEAVLLTTRFDRRNTSDRVPFMSAMTALDAKDHDEHRSYLELVDVVRQIGGYPEEDIRQLWRRMVFNILISNIDDHLRNHAFLRDAKGWRLSPAYDLNPCPADVGGRMHVLALNEFDRTSSLETAFSVGNYFGLQPSEANTVAAEVGAAVAAWKKTADAHNIPRWEIERLETAFEHTNLRLALSNRLTEPPRKGKGSGKAKAGPKKRRRPGVRKDAVAPLIGRPPSWTRLLENEAISPSHDGRPEPRPDHRL